MAAESEEPIVINTECVNGVTFDLSAYVRNANEASQSIAASLGRFTEALRQQLGAANSQLVAAIERMAPPMQSAICGMAHEGWYYDTDLGISSLLGVGRLLTEGELPQVDGLLSDHFERRLDAIEDSLAKRHPDRVAPLAAAFRAHRQGEYSLSVPVFLAQADGLSQQIIGQSLFAKNRDGQTPTSRAYFESSATNVVVAAVLSPLAEVQRIAMSAKDRGPNWDTLNRHQVLHGESSDYGTCTNSLKAISILNFVAQLEEYPREPLTSASTRLARGYGT